MNEKNENYLIKKYPTIFRGITEEPRSEVILPIYFGLECGDGWFNLLDVMCSQLKHLEDTYGILTIADQVKEKYGGLRFYHHGQVDGKAMTFRTVKDKFEYTWRINGGTKLTKPYKNFEAEKIFGEADGIVAMAEAMSYTICEKCGNPGTPNETGWISTLCKPCREKLYGEKETVAPEIVGGLSQLKAKAKKRRKIKPCNPVVTMGEQIETLLVG